VLRTEHRNQVDVVRAGHHIDLVHQLPRHAGRVGDDADLLAAQRAIAIGPQHIEPGAHRAAAVSRSRRSGAESRWCENRSPGNAGGSRGNSTEEPPAPDARTLI
jgi:hypothetical protein